MARIVARGPRKDGGMSYQVKWRPGGGRDGRSDGDDGGSETFKSPGCPTKAEQKKADAKAEADAKKFRAAVEAAGEQWPRGFVPGMGSAGWNEAAYALYIAEKERAAAEAAMPAVTTFTEFAYKVIDHLTGIQERTRADYRRDVRLHMVPTFGDCDIADEKALDEYAIAAWILDLRAGYRDPDDENAWIRPPKAIKTIKNLHATLFVVFKAAVKAKLRTTNPCDDTAMPVSDDEEDEEMVFLDRAEFRLLLDAANPDVHDLMIFLVNTGLRWSEATALQVRDLELDIAKPRLRVRRAWKRQPDYSFKLGPPKTKQSKRNVALTPSLVEMLKRVIEGRKPDDFVFVTATRGVPWGHAQFFGTRWKPAVYRAIRCEMHRDKDGLKRVNKWGIQNRHLKPCGCPGTLTKVPRTHDLRHTHVAELIAGKTPMLAIQKRLGHKSIKTTSDRYGHLLDEVEDDMVATQESRWVEHHGGTQDEEADGEDDDDEVAA